MTITGSSQVVAALFRWDTHSPGHQVPTRSTVPIHWLLQALESGDSRRRPDRVTRMPWSWDQRVAALGSLQRLLIQQATRLLTIVLFSGSSQLTKSHTSKPVAKAVTSWPHLCRLRPAGIHGSPQRPVTRRTCVDVIAVYF